MEEVSGLVEGSGTLQGPLLEPSVNGELVLSDGRVIDPMVPIPVSDLNLRLAFAGKRATLDGSWQSNGSGRGEIGGALDWEDTPVLTLVLEGEQLPLNYEPYAQLKVSPDLELRFVDGDLSIAGRIAVPTGQIEVRELPEQAVTVSDDEVIVGREPEPPPVRSMSMDVTVVVGEDEVTFDGFGVTGELEGELRIGNNMDTRGALQLVDGRYEAFGQELDLRRARLVFVGAVSEPYLDIEAVRRVDNVVAGIRLSGPAREPQTEVFSEPPMSQDQALSYVILGRPLQSQGDQGQVSRAALSLGLNRASGLTRGIGEAFGIQDLTLEAEGSGEDSAVVASGYLTEDLSLRYGVGLFEPITTVALRYDLGRYFYVEAASGLASSLDIFYTRDF
jgi:translocation and assembly module TamB